jgi:hypothetical protein
MSRCLFSVFSPIMTMANSSTVPAVEQIQFGYIINGSYPVFGTANWFQLGQNQSRVTSQAPVGDSRGWTHWAWIVSGSMATFYRNGFFVNTVDMGPTLTALTSNRRVLHYLGAGVSLVDNRCVKSSTRFLESSSSSSSSFGVCITSLTVSVCVRERLTKLVVCAVHTGVKWGTIACSMWHWAKPTF